MNTAVGTTCVNALSDFFIMTIYRNKEIHEITFKNGIVDKPLRKLGTTKRTGTTITFRPNIKYLLEFKEEGFNTKRISNLLKTTSYLNPGLKLSFYNKLEKQKKITFSSKNGTIDFVNDHNKGKSILPEPISIIGTHKIKSKGKDKSINVECNIAFLWNNTEKEEIYGFVNGLQVSAGTHITGLKLALATEIKKVINERNMLKGKNKNIEINGEDTREGLICIVSVKLPEPQFHGQTKDNLGSNEAQGAVQKLVGEVIRTTLSESPSLAKVICNRTIAAAQARRAAKRARDLVRKDSISTNISLPTKLKDCISRKPEECEMFICEGSSAGGSAEEGRDRKTQAIYSIRGKILNTQTKRIDQILKNKEIKGIISAVGTGIGSNFDISKLRYHKICTLTDADVDGMKCPLY